MIDDEQRRPPAIPAELIAELAAAGGVCDACGGLHVPTIDVAILSLRVLQGSALELPWCSCDACPVCQPFREAVAQLSERRTSNYPYRYDFG